MKDINDLVKGDVVTIVFQPLFYNKDRKIVETTVLAKEGSVIYTANRKRFSICGEFAYSTVATLHPCSIDEYYEWKKEYDEKHKTIGERISEILKENI